MHLFQVSPLASSRVASLVLLCTAPPAPTPRPELTIDSLSHNLGDAIQIDSVLQEKLRTVWIAGWREQAAELAVLEETLSTEEVSLDLQQLLGKSESASIAMVSILGL